MSLLIRPQNSGHGTLTSNSVTKCLECAKHDGFQALAHRLAWPPNGCEGAPTDGEELLPCLGFDGCPGCGVLSEGDPALREPTSEDLDPRQGLHSFYFQLLVNCCFSANESPYSVIL